jgi:predicted metal-dependent peptidase
MATSKAEQILSQATYFIARHFPFFAPILLRLQFEADSGIPTAAVDKKFRLLYNPKFIEKGLSVAIVAILHEILHVFYLHNVDRIDSLMESNSEKALIAADLEINDDLIELLSSRLDFYISRSEDIKKIIEDGIVFLTGELLLPEKFKLPNNLTVFEYFKKLKGNNKKKNHICFHKVDKEIERDIENVIKRTAQEIINYANSYSKLAGNLPDNLVRTAKEILKPRNIPWDVELFNSIVSSVNDRIGKSISTFKYPNRRYESDIIYPSYLSNKPLISVIIDTSGSMSEEDLGLALGVVANALESFDTHIEVYAGDTEIHSQTIVKDIFDLERIQLIGGGGTDMADIIKSIQEQRPEIPEVIIVITDGYTTWPESEIENKTVIGVIVGKESSIEEALNSYKPPEFIKIIKCPIEEYRAR